MKRKLANQYDIVMISMSRWDGDYSSAALSLAKEFAKTRRVYYIDQPFTLYDVFKYFRNTSIQSRLKPLFLGKNILNQPFEAYSNFTVVTPWVMLPINWLPDNKIYKFFQRINNFIFFSSLRKLIKENKINNFIFFNSFNPFYASRLPADIQPTKFVYQTRDDISVSVYVYKHGVSLEREAVLNADVVMATSKELTKKLTRFGRKVFQLPNAADISLFKYDPATTYARPKEIENIDTKIIGYMGNFDGRLDFDLFYEIVIQNKDKTILVVGPRNDNSLHNYNFNSFPNLVFTGSKNINELPSYLYFMDCTIIPFKINALTKSIYPLKINEYLAAGKPVVTTNFSEDVIDFRNHVYLSENMDSFIKGVSNALKDHQAGFRERVELAANNSWENRAKQFWEILELGEKSILKPDEEL